MSEDPNFFQPDGTNAAIMVGQTQTNGAGTISLYGPNGINMMNQVDMHGNKIVNLAKGDVNSMSGDAVNGSQLYGVSSSVANALGGGSSVNADGSVSAPSYSVGGATVNNVGDAISNLDGRVAQNTGDIAQNTNDIANLTNDINNGSMGLVKQDPTTQNITVAASTGGTVVDMTGTQGARRITGVAAGAVNAGSVDAINGAQLYNVSGSVANALGGGSSVNPDGSVSAPSYSVGGATVNNVGDAIGNLDGRVTQNTADIAQNTSDIANLANNINNGSIGLVKQDPTTQNITVAASTGGTVVDMTGTQGARTITGVAAGAVNAGSVDAINGAQLYNVSGSVANALGGGSSVNPDGSVSAPSYAVGGTTVNNVGDAIGNLDGRVTQNTADIANLTNDINNGSVGLVKQDPTTQNITVAASTGGTVVDMTGTQGARTITGVAAGAVNAASVDAVNGGQLYGVSSSVADAIGGGSTVNADGSISAPSFNVGGTTVNSVGAAVSNLDGRVAQNTSDISNMGSTLNSITTGGAGIKYFHSNSSLADSQATGADAVAVGGNAKATASNSVALGANSVADRANTVSVGSEGNERQITHVAAGTQGTDAVNVDQLNAATSQANAYSDQRLNAMQNTVNEVAKNAYAGVASAMAMPNLTPSAPGKTVVAAGAGVYKSGSAAAVGVTYRSESGKWLTNGAVSVSSTGDAGARVQVGYEF